MFEKKKSAKNGGGGIGGGYLVLKRSKYSVLKYCMDTKADIIRFILNRGISNFSFHSKQAF